MIAVVTLDADDVLREAVARARGRRSSMDAIAGVVDAQPVGAMLAAVIAGIMERSGFDTATTGTVETFDVADHRPTTTGTNRARNITTNRTLALDTALDGDGRSED